MDEAKIDILTHKFDTPYFLNIKQINQMKNDVSIHFTIKGQTVEELDKKLSKFFDENQNNLPFDFSEPTSPRSILHHCFLPLKEVEAKGFSTDVYDVILDQLSEHKVCWFGTSPFGLVWDRQYMLENLKKVNGVAVFLGEIKEGVEKEFEMAEQLEIDCILIP